MPELPEVETMRRGVAGIVGQTIERATQPPCERKPILMKPSFRQFAIRVRGKRIDAVDRLGKRVLVRLEDDCTIVMEPRMTGLVLLEDPPTEAHLRLHLELSGGDAPRLLFWDRRGLGTVSLFSRNQLRERVEDRLGPDALGITADELRARLKTSRRAIKVALLDQSVVAGIGNLYAAEILFVAGVDPRGRCDRLTKIQWERIVAATLQVLAEAIEHEGSTLSDGTYRNALNVQGSYQNCHRVYDRSGQPCPRCSDGIIRRIVQAQRSTFFCPRCQRKTGVHASLSPFQGIPVGR